MTVIGMTAPVTFAVTSGTLPSGLSLNPSTGVVSGTPTENIAIPGRTVIITATDSFGISAFQTHNYQFDQPPALYSFSSVTFTPVKYGVAIRITREMMEDSQFDVLTANMREVGRRFAENETSMVITALDGANTTVAGGAALTIANISAAILAVNNEDYIPTDFIIGNEVLSDLQNIDTFVEANKAGNTDMMSRGFIGTIFGLNVARFSTNAAPSTTYTKYGYVFDRRQAYAIAIKRDVTVENFTLPSYDMEGAAITQRLDVQLLRNKAIAKITTS
jgi:HK97 family phage major capsid protein